MKRHTTGFFNINFTGLIVGTLFYCFALTPSLLPRPALFAGAIGGVSFAVGYMIGVFVSWIARGILRAEPSAVFKRIAWRVVLGLEAVCIVAYSVWNAGWENQVRHFIDDPTAHGQHAVTIIGVAAVVAVLMLIIGKAIAWVIRKIGALIGSGWPAYISIACGTAIVAAISVLLYNGVVSRVFVQTTNNIYSQVNDTTAPGVYQPTTDTVSGSPHSRIAWKTLGYQGRSFVSSGPSQQKITQFTGQPAEQPVRVYVGLESAASAKDRANLAVAELVRTGAFNRKLLVVAGTTGTGWIEPQSVDAIEYMWHGNSAIVATQYSYLPSWISFLVDQQKATDASRALFEAVYAKWQTLPPDHRPKLIAYGLSLGSFGAQAAFNSVHDVRLRTDGALFMGTPNFTPLWRTVEQARDTGSPEWQPRYQQGQTVRFAATNDAIKSSQSGWRAPRILYVQHASDPVVWWNYNLIWHKPDWLKEKRGPDVSPNMQWYPFVTFAQVTVDQFFGTIAPDGHGHNYSKTIVNAWQAVTEPAQWSSEQSSKLQRLIDTYPDG